MRMRKFARVLAALCTTNGVCRVCVCVCPGPWALQCLQLQPAACGGGGIALELGLLGLSHWDLAWNREREPSEVLYVLRTT
jgi:hypothetical protein